MLSEKQLQAICQRLKLYHISIGYWVDRIYGGKYQVYIHWKEGENVYCASGDGDSIKLAIEDASTKPDFRARNP